VLPGRRRIQILRFDRLLSLRPRAGARRQIPGHCRRTSGIFLADGLARSAPRWLLRA